MNKRLFEWYQYIAPAILTPLSFWLWFQVYAGEIKLVLNAWLIPIMYAYIVPAIGTNVLKVWEFDTRFRLGRFRPHHGFVFGSASSMIAWICHFGMANNLIDIIIFSVLIAIVLGFINVIYDIKAIESGLLIVYNQPWADNQGARAITLDYAPWFFAGFGVVYGASIGGAEWLYSNKLYSFSVFTWVLPLSLILSIAVPVLGYIHRSFRVHGHSGCKPISRKIE